MAEDDAEEIVTKGEFATLCKVSPGRVTQWISEGKIGSSAMVGEGRTAKIKVLRAQADLKRSLDPAQMTGNGLRTRIPSGPLVAPVAAPDPQPSRPPPPAGPAEWSPVREGEVLDPATEKALLTREQRESWRMRNAERRGELIDASEADRRWTEEIVEIRSVILGVSGELPLLLPHLSPGDLDVIDRTYRDALNRAAGGGA